ncbi:hypothetical protein [Gordonia sp. (in: high G+C Gram-positive bacteria)]|jgi:polyhydroxyalkanoate synthesis regulator phasin|uniref:hypothetical protein n=1 Tax=Gordonia sp. (in: high G+C Gram-positive bacteria) TaxID=84139 RepID=UPI001DD1B0B4|nr:hypothetical protein [Gordonia sp. (in: high G+C Gram-positive bacteria)]MCB1296641.1 hypothetical protein [Gordonia sp. (in: high G+C Gram-positive bacteria)]HMS75799.1 hypothetical protein [Gordonia sp. (in: high G+C Gram-positive bacteria)]HQV17006.1 hypothetical protein [Gordonia sp. (in: high G+C Gram-positive bacteria)]
MGARRKNTFTTFLSDVIDDSKALVDDLIDRAQEFEEKARDAATSALGDDDADSPSADEVATLKQALSELTAKVDQLAAVKAGAK